jgi:hypothetical protein
MELSKKELGKVRAVQNYILVKPNFNTDKVQLKGGGELEVDGSYDREKHSATTGEVISVPEKLFFSYDNGLASVDFDVDMELMPGDTVYFHYLSVMNALRDNRFFTVEGEHYLWIKYDSMYVAKRGKEVVPINGWMIMEPIIVDQAISSFLEIPQSMKDKKSEKYARVKHIGAPVRNYLKEKDISEVNVKLEEGDVVMYDKHSDIPLQYQLHADFDGLRNVFFRMQRKDVAGILKGTEDEIMDIIKHNN